MLLMAQVSAYKRLGLWKQWRDSLHAAWKATNDHITSIEEAEYCK